MTLTKEQAEFVVQLYVEQQWPLDKLPYTKEFEEMYSRFTTDLAMIIERGGFWTILVALRKKGLFPNKTGKETSRETKRRERKKKKQFGEGFGLI